MLRNLRVAFAFSLLSACLAFVAVPAAAVAKGPKCDDVYINFKKVVFDRKYMTKKQAWKNCNGVKSRYKSEKKFNRDLLNAYKGPGRAVSSSAHKIYCKVTTSGIRKRLTVTIQGNLCLQY